MSLSVRRIHWVSWHPTPYHDYLFESLAKNKYVDLIVHYISPLLKSHPWKTAFGRTNQTRTCKLFLKIDWRLLLIGWQDANAYFLIASWNHPTAQALLTMLRLLKRAYGVWTDTPDSSLKRKPLKAILRQLWLKWIFSGATHVLGTGKPAIYVLEQMGAPRARLLNFPFFVDLSSYKPIQRSIGYCPNRVIRLMSSGRLENRLKGHDIAIRALALVAGRGEKKFEYFIVGSGPDEENLRTLAKELKLETEVNLFGWVEPEELRSLYHTADILIHPSPVHDPFPNAILEAMAAGLVVLGSDVSGSALDRIEHGANGFVHSAGDYHELSEQISFLLENIQCICEIGKRARMTAELWPIEYGISTVERMIRQSV